MAKGEYSVSARQNIYTSELFEGLEQRYRRDHRTPQGATTPLTRRWRHLSPFFGSILARNVTTDRIDAYIAQRQTEGAKNATINRELATLRRMFNLGRRSTPPKITFVPYFSMLSEKGNVRLSFVEDEDFYRLANATSELWLRTFLELAYSYGWRKGELLGLQVRNVNFYSRTIRLASGTTKNGEGREVAMTGRVFELLREATAGKNEADYVLTRENNRPVKSFRKSWKDLVGKAGLPHLIPHDLRRSAAKALRRAGVPESVVMATGGWKTAAMFRRYAIVSRTDSVEAMANLERSRIESSPKAALIPLEPFLHPSRAQGEEKFN